MNFLTNLLGMFRAAPKRSITVVTAVALAAPLIGAFEGLRLSAYRDPVGIPTICFGETLNVQMGDTATKEECEAMLTDRVEQFYAEMAACVPLDGVPVQTQAAFLSFTYNVGSGAFCKSTMARLIREGNLRAACEELPKWVYGGGKKLPGLVNRRTEERALCLQGLAG
jgi:lysozyme